MLLAPAVDSCTPTLDAARQSVELAVLESVSWVYGAAVRRVQLFANLITNASRFSEADCRTAISARVNGVYVIVSVSVTDTGIGLPAEELLHIFDVFTRLDTPGERSSSGVGIGRALAKETVDLHGGSSEAFSAGRGAGSEFAVRMPLLFSA